MKKAYILISIGLLLICIAASLPFMAVAATYGKSSITADEIRDHYEDGKLKVLIVPGHEPDYGGTQYHDIKERQIVVMIAEELEKLIKEDEDIKIYRTRDNKSWKSTFAKYFAKEWNDIGKFIEDNKYKTGILAEKGKLERIGSSSHNDAAQDVALRLYGVNKWSNENDIDIALHLHINDAPRPNTADIGPYIGFSVYVPEKQYSNAKASKELAEALKVNIKKFMKVSNLPAESKGVVEDQDLIAVGAYNTSDAASVLIEYGYIYESQFSTEKKQRDFAKKAAKQTYLGLRDFLRKK
jgi:N-acetylmuramoyl-L-alanine amidase